MRQPIRKAQPTPTDVHVDAALTNISVAFLQDEAVFASSRVFPIVPVEKQTDKYYTYTRDDFWRDEAAKRAPGAETAGGGYRVSTDSYTCDVFAWHKDIDSQVRANSDPAIDPEEDAAKYVAQKLLIRRERQWVTDNFATGVWGTDKTVDIQWNDGASDPEADVMVGIETIMQNTGFRPNTMVVNLQVHHALKRHPLVKDRFKYVSDDSITEMMLARFFELQSYVVASATYATNVEGATAVYAFTHGKSALLCYSAPSPGLMVPSAGYTFVWRGLTGLNDAGFRTKNFRLERNDVDRVEGEMAWDNKIVSSALGYFFGSVVA